VKYIVSVIFFVIGAAVGACGAYLSIKVMLVDSIVNIIYMCRGTIPVSGYDVAFDIIFIIFAGAPASLAVYGVVLFWVVAISALRGQ